jgi:hypothetical protein
MGRPKQKKGFFILYPHPLLIRKTSRLFSKLATNAQSSIIEQHPQKKASLSNFPQNTFFKIENRKVHP